MDPWAPINGISLERYAELTAEVEGILDPAVQAAMVGGKGVNPFDWEAAKQGWTARMHDMSLQGQVTARFTPMYQEALARKSATAPAVDPAKHAVSGAMPGAVPPPGYGPPPPAYGPSPYGAQPGYPSQVPPPPGYPQQAAPSGYPQQAWPPQQQGYRPAPNYNAQASAFGNEVGNAFSAFGSALGSVVNSVVGTFSYGQAVMVQWSDGQRYPATVLTQQSGQVQVAFPDGRKVWVPQHFVVMR